MVYQSFIESDLRFTFNQDWVIKKYDNHVYFKILAGHGLKGVDFIGIYKKQFLYLIEVKNYKQRDYSPVPANWIDLSGDVPPLALTFIDKIDDTLRLIRVVDRALKRKWWFRILSFVKDLMGDTRLNKDWKFWRKVYDLSVQSSTAYSVLWLEVGANFLVQENLSEKQYLKKLNTSIEEQANYEPDSFSLYSVDTQDSNLPGLDVEFV